MSHLTRPTPFQHNAGRSPTNKRDGKHISTSMSGRPVNYPNPSVLSPRVRTHGSDSSSTISPRLGAVIQEEKPIRRAAVQLTAVESDRLNRGEGTLSPRNRPRAVQMSLSTSVHSPRALHISPERQATVSPTRNQVDRTALKRAPERDYHSIPLPSSQDMRSAHLLHTLSRLEDELRNRLLALHIGFMHVKDQRRQRDALVDQLDNIEAALTAYPVANDTRDKLLSILRAGNARAADVTSPPSSTSPPSVSNAMDPVTVAGSINGFSHSSPLPQSNPMLAAFQMAPATEPINPQIFMRDAIEQLDDERNKQKERRMSSATSQQPQSQPLPTTVITPSSLISEPVQPVPEPAVPTASFFIDESPSRTPSPSIAVPMIALNVPSVPSNKFEHQSSVSPRFINHPLTDSLPAPFGLNRVAVSVPIVNVAENTSSMDETALVKSTNSSLGFEVHLAPSTQNSSLTTRPVDNTIPIVEDDVSVAVEAETDVSLQSIEAIILP
jgi:hypothetical protein